MELKNQIVVVAGGSRGFGAAIAELVSERGEVQVIADLRGSEEAAAGLRASRLM